MGRGLKFSAVLIIYSIFFSGCSANTKPNDVSVADGYHETEIESKSYDLEENEWSSETHSDIPNDYSTDELISDESETEEDNPENPKEESQPMGGEVKESEFSEEAEVAKTWYLNEMEFDGVLITESTASEMAEGYDYIKDVYIEVDEDGREIDIIVQVESSTDIDTAKMAGEDVARYLAAQASYSTNSYREYKIPGSDNLGSLYDRYNLLLYIDDGEGKFNIYGAKVTSSDKITWR